MNKEQKKKLVEYYKNTRPIKGNLERVELEYVNVIEELTDLYLKRQKKFTFKTLELTPDEAMSLAWMLSGYLEDMINYIGIFKALTDKNRELFSTPIPLFLRNPKGFTPGSIHKKAVSYLVWYFFREYRPALLLSPTHEDLQTITGEFYTILKKKSKEVPRGSKVKEYLSLKGVTEAQEVKKRLVWFGMTSYLFTFSMRNQLKGMNMQKPDITAIDACIQERATRLSGLNALDIFVQMADLEKDLKNDLKAWATPYMSLYRINEIKDDYWVVENMISHQQYNVSMADSQSSGLPGHIAKEGYSLGSIVPWNNAWCWTGGQLVYPSMTPEQVADVIKRTQIPNSKLNYRFCEKTKEKATDVINQQHENFVKHFKTDVVTFSSGTVMRDEINAFFNEINKEKLAKISEEEKAKHNLQEGTTLTNYPEELLKSEDVAALHVKDKGITYFTGFGKLVKALEKKGTNLAKEDEDVIHDYVFFDDVPYQLFHLLKKDHTFESVGKAFRIKDWQDEPDLEYLLRSYKGNVYKDKYPNIKLV
ncbi:MAG: DUF3843 family protein [bacterium]|nr:DUF3843 family protein [bacterium]